MRLKGLVLLAAVAMATNAYAQNTPKTATGTNTVSATLAVKATLAKAESLGGKTVMPKFSPAPDTFLAMVADPEGHIVGLSEGGM